MEKPKRHNQLFHGRRGSPGACGVFREARSVIVRGRCATRLEDSAGYAPRMRQEGVGDAKAGSPNCCGKWDPLDETNTAHGSQASRNEVRACAQRLLTAILAWHWPTRPTRCAAPAAVALPARLRPSLAHRP